MTLSQTPAPAPPTPQRDWDALFDPRVVALVGASANPTKWGHLVARNLLQGAGRRTVRLVTRSGGEILGQPAFRSLAELPEAPDLVIVVVPQASVEETVDAALAAGAKAIVVITVGFRESGPLGAELEARIAEKVRDAGALLIGPNCNGIRVDDSQLDAMTWLDDPRGGHVGVISQSGGVITELVTLGRRSDLGFSRLVSFGNQADVTAAELLRALADDPSTHVIGAYLEEVRDLPALIDAAGYAAAAGKPVVFLTPPDGVATTRAAHAHTGSVLASQLELRSAARAAGILHVSTPADLIEAAETLRATATPAGPRVGVVADGGGQAVLGTGAVLDHGLEVPRLSDAVDAALVEATAGASARRNPVDITGGSHFELSDYAAAIRVVAESGEVDAVVFSGMFGGYKAQSEDFVADELEAAHAIVQAAAGPVPVVVHTWYDDTEPARILRRGGVPVFNSVNAAVRAVVRLYEREHRERPRVSEHGVRGLVDAARAEIPALSTPDLAAELAAGDVLVIDVRDERERVRDGAIPQARHVPRGFVEFWADPRSPYHRDYLDPAQRTVVYCAGGWRSALAAKSLRELGYRDVAHLDTGYDGWKRDGGEWAPVEAR